MLLHWCKYWVPHDDKWKWGRAGVNSYCWSRCSHSSFSEGTVWLHSAKLTTARENSWNTALELSSLHKSIPSLLPQNYHPEKALHFTFDLCSWQTPKSFAFASSTLQWIVYPVTGSEYARTSRTKSGSVSSSCGWTALRSQNDVLHGLNSEVAFVRSAIRQAFFRKRQTGAERPCCHSLRYLCLPQISKRRLTFG